MQFSGVRRGGATGLIGVLVAAGSLALAAAPAAAGGPVVVRGELARLHRQHYDYHYRNSNRNVFRRSRHFHPTKNVFRSSRYYQRRLEASYAGYPLLTVVQHGHHGKRGHTYVHPRRSPYGPSYDGEYYGGCPCGCSPVVVYNEAPAAPVEPAPPARPPRPKKITRADIEMLPVRVAKREAKQKAVLRTVTLPDGRVRTMITSVPIEETEPAPEEALTADTSG